MRAVALSLGSASQGFQSRLEQIDFQSIRIILQEKAGAASLDQTEASRLEEGYRQFLILTYLYPEVSLVPTREIDDFWHCHILDTRKYPRDCELLFGQLLHHNPYFGIGSKESRKELSLAFQQTAVLAELHFGERSAWRNSAAQPSVCDSSSSCRHGFA